MTTLALAASVFAATTGTALAQSSYGTFSGSDATSEPHILRADPHLNADDNPAGVIDGTNPNPNPTEAGGILSPDALVNW